jgi:hypothetical protein
MTVPAVGPIASLLFVATLDDIKRFESATKVGAYLGLTPGEHSSSDSVRRTGITKAGSGPLRRVLVQAALSIKRFRRDDPMVKWALKIQERRGRHIATVALARKLAGVLFALWRDDAVDQPARAAESAPEMSVRHPDGLRPMRLRSRILDWDSPKSHHTARHGTRTSRSIASASRGECRARLATRLTRAHQSERDRAPLSRLGGRFILGATIEIPSEKKEGRATPKPQEPRLRLRLRLRLRFRLASAREGNRRLHGR